MAWEVSIVMWNSASHEHILILPIKHLKRKQNPLTYPDREDVVRKRHTILMFLSQIINSIFIARRILERSDLTRVPKLTNSIVCPIREVYLGIDLLNAFR